MERLSPNHSGHSHNRKLAYADQLSEYFGIGADNEKSIACVLEGGDDCDDYELQTIYRNVGANDHILVFAVPVPITLSSYGLVLNTLTIGLADADTDDCVDRVRIYKHENHGTVTKVYDYTTNLDSIGTHVLDLSDIDVSDSYRVVILLSILATTALQFDMSYVVMGYYYD